MQQGMGLSLVIRSVISKINTFLVGCEGGEGS